MAARFYDYPVAETFDEIAQVVIPRLTMQSPLFRLIMNIEDEESTLIRWIQEDNYVGLQNVRGIGGRPRRVALVNEREYMMKPGVYGEFIALDEETLTQRRSRMGPGKMPIADLVARAFRQLLTRRISRIEQIGWNLVIQGVFSVADPSGTIVHTDSYTPQTFTAIIPWSQHATATPFADIRNGQLVPFGKSVVVDASSTFLMARPTFNHMVQNTNPNDLGGLKGAGFESIVGLDQVNVLLGAADLPRIEVYDGFYPDVNNVAQRFIPVGQGLLAGRRMDGEQISSYKMTFNLNNGGMPGAYSRVLDHSDDTIPMEIEVHDGHNGGPVLKFPSALVVFNNLV